DQLPIALVILLDGVAGQDAPQLRQRRARRRVVHRLGDGVLVGHQAERLQFRVPDVPQPHQVGARLLEGGEVFLQRGAGAALREVLAQPTRSVADHFVHRRQHVFRLFAVLVASSGVAANSELVFADAAAESAWLLPRNRKFFVPYISWISFSFGRLSPIVVTWKSPVSTSTCTALTTGGVKSCFLYFASHGAFCSK